MLRANETVRRNPFSRTIRFALGFALLASAVADASAQEVIHRFDSLVQVARDGTLIVTETVRVRAEGREIRRGIYRDFPLTFRDLQGRSRQVSFELLAVERDGRSEPHHTVRTRQGIRIYAGSENVLLRPGQYSYTFRYRTGRQVRWFDEGAELFWNVTGNEWVFPITRARVRFELTDGARPSRWTAYTGFYGERGTDWKGDIDSVGVLSVETTRSLAPKEGFSVVVGLPESLIESPSGLTRLGYLFLDYGAWILTALGFAVLFLYYLYAWNAVGRDPKGGTIIPLFYPPADISPALASYVRNWGLGRNMWRAFTAAALSLAVRGVLLFDDKGDLLTLRLTGKEPEGGQHSLPAGERTILDWVHSQGGSATIARSNATAVAAAGKSFRESIEKENREKFFRRNLIYFLGGILLTIGTVAGVLLFGNLDESDYVVLFAMGFLSIWLGIFFIPFIGGLFKSLQSGSVLRVALLLAILVPVALFFFRILLPLVPGGLFSAGLQALSDYPFPFVLVFSFATLNGLFLYLLRAPTDLGRKVLDGIEGLRMYLKTAESARLNMNAPEITTERFEALLPYAVALDVEKPWAEAFQAALARAHPRQTGTYRPRWATGSNWSGANLGRTVSSSVTAATGAFSSAVPASSSGSSGFSGGGGSGGGGGGGGGGGW